MFIGASSSSVRDNNPKHAPELGWTGRSTTSTGFFLSDNERNPWLRVHIKPAVVSGITIVNRNDDHGLFISIIYKGSTSPFPEILMMIYRGDVYHCLFLRGGIALGNELLDVYLRSQIPSSDKPFDTSRGMRIEDT